MLPCSCVCFVPGIQEAYGHTNPPQSNNKLFPFMAFINPTVKMVSGIHLQVPIHSPEAGLLLWVVASKGYKQHNDSNATSSCCKTWSMGSGSRVVWQ